MILFYLLLSDDNDEQLSERSRKSLADDINGNRLEPINTTCYMQMRDVPKTEGSLFCKQGNGTYNQNKQIIDTSVHGQKDRDLDNSSSNLDGKKKRRRKSEEPVKLSHNFPDYVGNKFELDELVQFIEKGEKQLKKKLNRKNTTTESVAKPDKLNKKIKDKKEKIKSFDSADVSLAGEQSVGSSSSTNTASICEDMGNSSEKPSTNTNEKNNPDEDTPTKADNQVLKNVDAKGLKLEMIKADDKNNEVNNQIDEVVASKCICPTKKEAEPKDKNRQKVVKEKPVEVQEVNKKVIKTEDNVDNKKTNKQRVKAEMQVKNNKKVENMVIENGPSQVVADRSNRDLSTSPNSSSFIFTDIDLPPPVEPEFTVVGKTKKKKRVINSPVEYPKHKNSCKEFRTIQPRSATPPPPSKEKSHDLSPSAFPVLTNVNKCASGKVRPTLREGRRNSLGDVPIDSGSVRSWDDSDIESVKSLPAVQGGRLADVASSRFPVSYAKMVAATKPPTSPNSSVPLSPGSCDEDLSSSKPTIWKGSLHERRHSIGSSPEDTKPDTSPKFNQRIRQKSGSEDILKIDKIEALQMDVKVALQMDVKVSDISSETLTDKGCDRNLESCADVACHGYKPLPVDVIVNSTLEKLSATGSDSRIPAITFTSGSNMSELVLKGDKLDGPKNVVKSVVSNTNETSRSHTASVKDPSSSSVSDSCGKTTVSNSVNKDPGNKLTNVVNNGRKPKSSVVFLDKRFVETPQKLDITFGFDSNLEMDNKSVMELDKSGAMSSSVNSIAPSSPIIVSMTSVARNKMIGDNNQSIHSSSVPIGCVKNCKLAANMDKSGDGSTSNIQSGELGIRQPLNSSNVIPGKAHITGLNGVVQSHSQGFRHKPTSDALRTEKILSEKTDNVTPNHDTTIIVFYGEGILAKIGESQICVESNVKRKQIKFVPDNNVAASKFNATEVVSFLKTGNWLSFVLFH